MAYRVAQKPAAKKAAARKSKAGKFAAKKPASRKAAAPKPARRSTPRISPLTGLLAAIEADIEAIEHRLAELEPAR